MMMARFSLVVSVLYFALSAIAICASAEGSRSRASSNGRGNNTTTAIPPSTNSTTTTTTSTAAPTTTSTSIPAPVTSTSAAPTTVRAAPTATTLASQPSAPVQQVVDDYPQTLPDFIVAMMKKFGAAKAAEAFQSLDQLPLGLIMKILLVEVDKQLAADIVAMQRYAQTTDKALIQMIGRIVAADKNVPKEIFTMDQKLMTFPWWMRIRQRMFNNLEKYVAAYSLVPVAAKSAINRAATDSNSRSVSNGLESIVQGPRSDLTATVAASATQSQAAPVSQLELQQRQQLAELISDHSASASAPAPVTTPPLRISLLNPIQQQQIIETLALAQAAAGTNAQVQQLLQFQQATRSNPFLVG